MVPKTGVEPVRCCHRGILSPVRLPVPPLRQMDVSQKEASDLFSEVRLEDWRRHPDLNRGIRVLQTLALPLGYGAVDINLGT